MYPSALSEREWPSSSLPVSVTRIRLVWRAISFEGLLSRGAGRARRREPEWEED